MSHFGPGVIGDQAYRHEEKIKEKSLSHFGPGVIGEELAALEAESRAALAASTEDAVPASVSVKDMADALAKNPELFDTFFLAELNRAGGPRRKALNALREAELAREGGAREAVMEQLDIQLQII